MQECRPLASGSGGNAACPNPVRHGDCVEAPNPASGHPRPVAGRSLRASMPFAHSMLPALVRAPPLRHPWLRWPATPAPGAWMALCLRLTVSSPSGRHGVARAPRAGLGGKRSQDGEAQPACRERRAGCPKRTSGDGAWDTPCRLGGLTLGTKRQTGLNASAVSNRLKPVLLFGGQSSCRKSG
jgi:hypothetical protein